MTDPDDHPPAPADAADDTEQAVLRASEAVDRRAAGEAPPTPEADTAVLVDAMWTAREELRTEDVPSAALQAAVVTAALTEAGSPAHPRRALPGWLAGAAALVVVVALGVVAAVSGSGDEVATTSPDAVAENVGGTTDAVVPTTAPPPSPEDEVATGFGGDDADTTDTDSTSTDGSESDRLPDLRGPSPEALAAGPSSGELLRTAQLAGYLAAVRAVGAALADLDPGP